MWVHVEIFQLCCSQEVRVRVLLIIHKTTHTHWAFTSQMTQPFVIYIYLQTHAKPKILEILWNKNAHIKTPYPKLNCKQNYAGKYAYSPP